MATVFQRLKKHFCNILLAHGVQNRPIVCPHVWWCLIDGIFSLWIPFSQALTNVGESTVAENQKHHFYTIAQISE
jgi:hypothetical protein